MENEALLQAVADNPDDDLLRLVYADWLDERGDPRGEFIRIQCQLAALALGDSSRAELEQEEAELRETHLPEWLAPLMDLDLQDILIDRGFVEGVNLSAESFEENGEALFRLAPTVRSLTIHGARGRTSQLADTPLLARVLRLSLANNTLRPADLRPLVASDHLNRLRHLDLASNDLRDRGVEILVEAPWYASLLSLSLNDNSLYGASMSALASAGKLRELRLASNDIRLSGLTALCRSQCFGNLQCLDISENRLPSVAAQLLIASTRLPALRQLHLRENRLRLEGVRALAGAGGGLQNLEQLDIRNNGAQDKGAILLATSGEFPKLHSLGLSANLLTDQACFALVHAAARLPLRHLELASNYITDVGIQTILDSDCCRQLTYLDVRNNQLSDLSLGQLHQQLGARVRM